MKPVKNNPTKCSPCSADAPTGEHIGWIVDAKINAADADKDGKKSSNCEEVKFHASAFLGTGK